MLLALDTSTGLAGVALYDGTVRAELTWHAGRNHTTQVLPAAVRLLADKQTDVLTALDRFLVRSNELGIGQDTTADLRRGRVVLAEFLGIALQEVERAKRLLRALTDGVAGGGFPP